MTTKAIAESSTENFPCGGTPFQGSWAQTLIIFKLTQCELTLKIVSHSVIKRMNKQINR